MARLTGELKAGEIEAMDRLMDETLETIQALLKVLREAQARGVLERVVSQDCDAGQDS
jgi:hypothetical protein